MSLYLGENLISGQTTLVGESRNIGQIIPSAIPLTDAGLHLLDGSLIQGGGIYSAFVTHIAGLVSTYPNLFVSESDWQTAVTTYGVCGKFVYDSTNNTVRLPKVTGIIEGTTDVTALGDLVEAGLPNITGTFSDSRSGAVGTHTGCFSNSYNSGTSAVYDGGISGHMLDFNASLSNAIYGNSPTVQPQTIKAFYYIVIATSTKTDIEVDIDEIATDLNSKVSTGDLAEVQCVIETYSNGTSWYRVYSDGWCEQGGYFTGSAITNNSVSLLKNYVDTSYNVLLQVYGNGYDYTPAVHDKTTSSFQYGARANYTNVSWQASGYII